MSYLQLSKQQIEAIKGITRLLVFLFKKCWIQITALLTFIIFIWSFYGGFVALSAASMGLLFVAYKVGDWFIYHPLDPPDSRFNVPSPSVMRLPFESHFIQTIDGVTINVVLIKQEPEKMASVPTIIFLHGNAGNVGHRLQNVHEMYHYLKVNILLVEYRGYGLSKGKPSERGLYLDGEAALHYLLQHPSIDKSQLILFGRSLGGAVAIDLVRNSALSPHIAGIIIENTFTSIPDIAKVLFDCKFIRLIPKWFYKNKFDSLSKVARVSTPILYLSGQQDELIPPAMMSLLFQTSSASIFKQLHSFEGGSHNFTWRCNDYYEVIARFIHKVTSTRTTPASIVNHYTLSTTHPVTPEKTRQLSPPSTCSTSLTGMGEDGATIEQIVATTTAAPYYGLISPTTSVALGDPISNGNPKTSNVHFVATHNTPMISSISSQSGSKQNIYYSMDNVTHQQQQQNFQDSANRNQMTLFGDKSSDLQLDDLTKDRLFQNIEII